jgi:predicted ArsR family transcriptional regulator
MSSAGLENKKNSSRGEADRFLMLLKSKGPQSSAELGKALRITDEAARQQLLKLAGEGMVEATSPVRGVGRPQQIWRLTPEAQVRFPDRHAELTVQLIGSIRALLGENALEQLIADRETQTRQIYQEQVAGSVTLEEKIASLAAIRSEEGYMAEWWPDGNGYLFVENHCPICAAASICQSFCRAELEIFREVIGMETRITRVEHIPAGARRCAYRIEAAVELL